jgi:uncharacterized protein YjaG (DUF416 family)
VNKRIKELKQQAGIDFNPDQEGLDLFAELIIIDVCNTLSEISNDDRIEKTTTDHMTKLFNGILEHVSEFLKEKYNVGVEE